MSGKRLDLFEFVPYPEAAEGDAVQKKPGPQQDLIGDTPLLLESDNPREDAGPQLEGFDPAGPDVRLEIRSDVPRHRPFVFASSEGRKLFVDATVRPVEERIGHDGFVLFLNDFHTATSVGVLRLQGASKYADVLARKKLQEQGELSASEHLLLYGVRRGRGREFSVLYQVVPRDALRAVEHSCGKHPGGMQYADTLGLLRGVLARAHGQRAGLHGAVTVRACALRLPGALLLLVAEGTRFVLAGRYPYMESSLRSLSGCLAAIRRDVDAACAPVSDAPVPIQLVETGVPTGGEGQLAVAAAGQRGFELLPPCILEQTQGGQYVSALPEFVGDFSLSYALGPGAERLLRPLERFEKLAWAMLCAGILFCCGVAWFAGQQARTLDAQAKDLRRELRRTADRSANRTQLPMGGFSEKAALAGLLDQACGSPNLAEVWNRLGTAKPQALSVTGLKLTYAPERVHVLLQGRVYADLQNSQDLALEFLARLRSGGARILAHQLDLSANDEQFLSLELEYLDQKGGD